MTFFNNWMFLYPPGILALAVFKLVYEESGIQDFESLISKQEEISIAWKFNKEKVEEFLSEFRQFDFKENDNKHAANEVIGLCLSIKRLRDATRGGDNFQ